MDYERRPSTTDEKSKMKAILGIRLCQECKRWDQMVDKIDQYLKSN